MHRHRRTVGLVFYSLAVALCGRPALAGNLLKEIECGNPPKLEPTAHSVRVVNFEQGVVDERGELIVPIDGRIDELWLDGTKVTLKQPNVYRGFIETEEYGSVFFFLSSSMGPPGYFVVVPAKTLDLIDPPPDRERSRERSRD